MASGDTVFEKTSMTVASMSVSNFGNNGWTGQLNVGGTTSPNTNITFNILVGTPTGAPFDITKTYDVIVKEH